jgi:hypothetical protein
MLKRDQEQRRLAEDIESEFRGALEEAADNVRCLDCDRVLKCTPNHPPLCHKCFCKRYPMECE